MSDDSLTQAPQPFHGQCPKKPPGRQVKSACPVEYTDGSHLFRADPSLGGFSRRSGMSRPGKFLDKMLEEELSSDSDGSEDGDEPQVPAKRQKVEPKKLSVADLVRNGFQGNPSVLFVPPPAERPGDNWAYGHSGGPDANGDETEEEVRSAEPGQRVPQQAPYPPPPSQPPSTTPAHDSEPPHALPAAGSHPEGGDRGRAEDCRDGPEGPGPAARVARGQGPGEKELRQAGEGEAQDGGKQQELRRGGEEDRPRGRTL